MKQIHPNDYAIVNGYNLAVAKKYGINSAVLLTYINRWCKYTPRKDGFCWKTRSEIEDDTALTDKEQRLAIQKLKIAGLIEVKKDYILDTKRSCLHFKPIISKSPENEFPHSSERDEPREAERDEPLNRLNYNNKLYLKSTSSFEEDATALNQDKEPIFDFEKTLEVMAGGKRQDLLMANYWYVKGIVLKNKAQYQYQYKRDIKAALKLAKLGYTDEEIIKATDYCKKNYKDIPWTLETILKIIAVANSE